MKRHVRRFFALLVLASPMALAGAAPSHYLFVWAMEAKHHHDAMPMLEHGSPNLTMWRHDQGLGKDFLAVFDVAPGASFGKLVAMLPAGDAAMAHHTNYAEPPDDQLYANDWLGNRTSCSTCATRASRGSRGSSPVWARSAIRTPSPTSPTATR